MGRFSTHSVVFFALCVLAASACSGKDPYRPGESVGEFHVAARLARSTCGKTPDPWEFDVHLRHEKSTLYWVQGGAPISAIVDSTARAKLGATSSQTVRAADSKARLAACTLTRTDSVDIVLAPIARADSELANATSFKGTLSYEFAATEGSQCDDQLASAGGDFDTLPCAVEYAVDGVRTGDTK